MLSVAHLNFLHKAWLGTDIKSIIHHHWEATWTPGTDETNDKAFAYVMVKQGMGSFGKPLPGTSVDVKIVQCGPGMVHLDFPLIPGLIHIKIIEELLPVGPMMQRVRHSVYGSWTTPRPLAKLFLRLFVRIVEQDIAVWNNKTYLEKPMFSKPDRAIPVYRKWYGQFYSASSPKAAALLNPLDW